VSPIMRPITEKAQAEEAILHLLWEDDAGGRGYTPGTLAMRLWGPPCNPYQAADRVAAVEELLEGLLQRGLVQVASYIYLRRGVKIARYKLAADNTAVST